MANGARFGTAARGRAAAAALVIAGGLAVVVGTTMDWMTIAPAPRLFPVPDAPFDLTRVSEPCSGLDVREGQIAAAAGLVLLVAAGLFGSGRGRRYAWWSFVGSMVAGGVTAPTIRSIDEVTSSIARRCDVVGDADPALGIWLVVAGAFAGLAGSVLALGSDPPQAR